MIKVITPGGNHVALNSISNDIPLDQVPQAVGMLECEAILLKEGYVQLIPIGNSESFN